VLKVFDDRRINLGAGDNDPSDNFFRLDAISEEKLQSLVMRPHLIEIGWPDFLRVELKARACNTWNQTMALV
jgi:hypothetical protein